MSTDLTKKDTGEQVIEYTAFGSDQKVKLTIRLIKDIIAVKTKSGVPPTLQDCYKFAMLCKARALNPFEGDAFLIGYDCKDGAKFNLITAHQAFLKRAEVNPDFNGMESGIVVMDAEGKTVEKQGDYKEKIEILVGGWARVHFKNKTVPMFKKINLERFRKPFGVWVENAEGMITKCAEADALRSAFPTKMGGLYLKEEVEKIEDGKATGRTIMEDNAVDIMPLSEEPPSKAEQLAEKLGKKEVAEDQTSVATPPPSTPSDKAKPENCETLEGNVEATSKKANKKGYTYGVKVQGLWANTFDAKIGETAIAAKQDGLSVIMDWYPNGDYKNIWDLRIVNQVEEEFAPEVSPNSRSEELPFND